MQPTAYVRNAWQGRSYGVVSAISVASVHDGENWALRAEWPGVSAPAGDFPDAFAIALPVRGNPVLALMGSADAPMHVLRWQSREPALTSQRIAGIGQSAPGPALQCAAQARNAADRWRLVIARELASGGEVAPLAAGATTRIGFAVWRGDNDERAGIKAFSIDWQEMTLDP
ncbi:MAG: hypothetical protein IPG43_09360 [Proteobacteria bacterium]|nr:hypothetical protein [Pseudomonadota bacterium]